MLPRYERRAGLLIIGLSRLCSGAKLLASIEPEINHPLTALVINAQACQHWLFADPPDLRQVRTTVERMIHNANAVTGIVNHIHAPAEQAARVLADLNEVVFEVTDLVLDGAASEKIGTVTLEINLPLTYGPSQPFPVKADR